VLITVLLGKGWSGCRAFPPPRAPCERLSLGCDGYLDTYGITFGIVERIFRLSVGYCVGSNPELLSYPVGYTVLLNLDLDEPVIAGLFLLTCLLGYTSRVDCLTVGCVRGKVVLLTNFYFRAIVNWRVVVASALVIRLVPGSYSPAALKRAVILIGSPVVTIVVGLAV
jgi:hypothetical protein